MVISGQVELLTLSGLISEWSSLSGNLSSIWLGTVKTVRDYHAYRGRTREYGRLTLYQDTDRCVWGAD